MTKKKFRVRATNFEYLPEQIIEAESWEEAQDKYYELWEAGQISVCDSEINIEVEGVRRRENLQK